MPLLVHGEVDRPDGRRVRPRGACSSTRCSRRWSSGSPRCKVVFEHITTARAAEFVRRARAGVAATITPQHLLHNRNAMFAGGIRPHYYCLPVLKREADREALRRGRDRRQSALLPRHRQRAARARRQGERLRLRRHVHGARRASSCMPRPSSRPAASTAWRASRAISAPISTGCRATQDTITLVEGALDCRRSPTISATARWCLTAPASRSRWRLAGGGALMAAATRSPSPRASAASCRS